MTIIASWNVNSIKARIEHLLYYLESENAPDILLLQELKCEEKSFPFQLIEDKGYNIAVCGQKTYNGVAILSKFPIDDVIKILPGDNEDKQARYIEALIYIQKQVLRVASIYVPNGQSIGSDKYIYKMSFLDRLKKHAEKLFKLNEITILGGDYNIAPDINIDVYDKKNLDGQICCHIEERKKLRSILNIGFTDMYRALNNNQQQFSWWDYRGGSWQQNKGMRIDHLLASPKACDIISKCDVETSLRGKNKPSDHAPVFCTIN